MDLPTWVMGILPIDENPKALKHWRWSVGLSLLTVWMAFATAGIWVPTVLETAAHAQDAHQQLSKGLENLSQSVEKLASQLKSAEEARLATEKARLAAEHERQVRELRQQIYTTQRDACKAKDELRAVLQRQVNDLRSTFMALTGSEYPETPCSSF